MDHPTAKFKVLLLGASAGGIAAIQKILSSLSVNFFAPIIVVQHLPESFAVNPSLVFKIPKNYSIMEAGDKEFIEARHIYLAPSGYHLSIERDSSFSLAQDEPLHYCRPSLDVLFESAARSLGERCVGVLLTGANADGASGLRSIQKAGGMTMVQDPHEAESSMMPLAALELFRPDFVGTLEDISRRLNTFQFEVE
ncbi:hypothetical protein AZI86_12685 [Bdellovibrio bacteriovorus]|uniref:protein-glutamate methylesterase n=1 Tax=Bdellovibrio bacteriovorus TaxID=959 RepID=A0A150WJ02_BDEBC|nr:chemotaxis protein CheB [Bdellovibrio bacteriovorus]KYG63680.1 hypothetical protein AZI86_12685 [Bdellovibrio bacteriovorus]